MVLSKKRITKALISLRRCAGWSAPLLFAKPRRQAFLRRGDVGAQLLLYLCPSTAVNGYIDKIWVPLRENLSSGVPARYKAQPHIESLSVHFAQLLNHMVYFDQILHTYAC